MLCSGYQSDHLYITNVAYFIKLQHYCGHDLISWLDGTVEV